MGLHFFGEREKGDKEVLPWDHIDCEVTKPFLLKDRYAARKEAEIHRLRPGPLHRLWSVRL